MGLRKKSHTLRFSSIFRGKKSRCESETNSLANFDLFHEGKKLKISPLLKEEKKNSVRDQSKKLALNRAIYTTYCSALFVFLYFFGSLSGSSVFCWSAFLNWHFGPSQLSAVTTNSDQLS